MGKKTKSAIDYYVLFRDDSEHARQSNRNSSVSKPDECDDEASYLWCHIGKLTARQARGVQIKLNLEFKERFEQEKNSRCTNILEQIRADWSRLEQMRLLVQRGLDLAAHELTPSQRPLMQQQKTGFVARSPSGKEKLVISKKDVSALLFQCERLFQSERSFIQLLPLPTLIDIWHSIGCPTDVEPLRCTAIAWLRKTFPQKKVSVIGPKSCSDAVELVFKSSLDDQEMTASQREVLKKCVDVANSVREVDDCKDMNIENKYRLAQANIAATPPLPEGHPPAKPSEQIAEPAILSTTQDDAPEAGTAAVKEQEKPSKPKAKKANTVAKRLENLLHRRPDLDEATAESLAALLKCSKTAIINTQIWKQMVARRITKPGSLTKDDRASDKGAGKEALDSIEFDGN